MENLKFKDGTQKKDLYDYLMLDKTITTRDAQLNLGIMDLQGVIRDLKKAGVYICTIATKVPRRGLNKDGSKRYAYVNSYSIEKIFNSNTEKTSYLTESEKKEHKKWYNSPVPEKNQKELISKYNTTASGHCTLTGGIDNTINNINDLINKGL
tara:strand:- start:2888 stop:3346 length:459 start_codon:yes stop_codon:yes gene_type:complete